VSKNDNFLKNFKRNPIYQEILEHVNKETGFKYFNIIKEKYPYMLEHIDKFKTNDDVGNAIKFNYEEFEVSPTTLRYIKVLAEIIDIFGDLNDKNIILH
jgi:hypothetical protein